jgi:transcriptional regulator with XRE-family HTH domain
MEDTEGLIRRLIELRKNNGPTQARFGNLLGLSDGTISMIEAGLRPITEKHIKLVCGTLGINEIWLKTGEGPVFTEEIPGQKQLLDIFRQLSPKNRQMAINVIETMLKTQIDQAWNEGAGIPVNLAQNDPPEAEKRVNPIHGKNRG